MAGTSSDHLTETVEEASRLSFQLEAEAAASLAVSLGDSILPLSVETVDFAGCEKDDLHPAGLHAAVVASVRKQAAQVGRKCARGERQRRRRQQLEATERVRRYEEQKKMQEMALLQEMERLQVHAHTVESNPEVRLPLCYDQAPLATCCRSNRRSWKPH